MAANWKRRFNDPIPLPDGRQLVTALLSVTAGLRLPLSCAPALR
jgi:hypothetical protein